MTIAEYLQHDHKRLDLLLAKSELPDGSIDEQTYEEFREGLLLHIGIEEKLLFPAARNARNGEMIERAAKLRLDHGAITALLVLSPNTKVITALKTILEPHNQIEEGPPGVYVECEKVIGEDSSRELFIQIQRVPPPPLAVRKQSDALIQAAKRCIERAGFSGSMLD